MSCCSCDVAGIIQLERNGRPVMLSVGDEALSYLQRRADVSELAAVPQPYQVRLPDLALAMHHPYTQILALWLPHACLRVVYVGS